METQNEIAKLTQKGGRLRAVNESLFKEETFLKYHIRKNKPIILVMYFRDYIKLYSY